MNEIIFLRSDAWGDCQSNAGIGAFYFLRTRTKEDVLILGKAYHNNHHKYPSSVNFGGVRWHEVDPIYPIIRLLHWLHIIRIKDLSFKRVEVEF
jgi:hypothetical protein